MGGKKEWKAHRNHRTNEKIVFGNQVGIDQGEGGMPPAARTRLQRSLPYTVEESINKKREGEEKESRGLEGKYIRGRVSTRLLSLGGEETISGITVSVVECISQSTC